MCKDTDIRGLGVRSPGSVLAVFDPQRRDQRQALVVFLRCQLMKRRCAPYQPLKVTS